MRIKGCNHLFNNLQKILVFEYITAKKYKGFGTKGAKNRYEYLEIQE